MYEVDPTGLATLRADFAREAMALLEAVEAQLLAVEPAADASAWHAATPTVRRLLHTLKGNAGFVGAGPLQSAVHALEEVVPRLGAAGVAGGLLAALDALRAEVDAIAGGRPPTDGSEALAALARGELPASTAVRGVALGVDVTIRQGRLDELVATAGDVAVIATQLQRTLQGTDDQRLQALLDRLRASSRAMHVAALRARSIPVRQLLSRYERLVHDDAARLGKRVELHVAGGELELDKAVLDGLVGALTHLVRNAVAHGIEVPAGRTAARKREAGRVVLRARTRGSRVLISVEDDGRGLDPEAVRARARAQGLDATLPVEELVFAPGLSTATLGETAGRGIGLDAVRRDVLRLGGTLAVRSTPGSGTVFELEVPTTLALERGLVFDVGDATWAVPLSAVAEAVPLRRGALRRLRQGDALEHHGVLFPLVDAARLGQGAGTARFALLLTEGARVALPVTALGEQQDLVFHPFAADVRGHSLASAAALLGDGRLALRLDTEALTAAAPEPRA